MSDDAGRKPAPSISAERGVAAEPDGGHGVPGGAQRGAAEHGRDGRDGKDAEEADAAGKEKGKRAEGMPSTGADPVPGGKPLKPGTRPTPPHGGGSPSPTQQHPTLPPSEPTPEPPTSPTPQPSEPTGQPSASSAPEVHVGARRAAGALGNGEPAASPQDRPA
ncbi:hypothetical protein J7E88_30335 [Streptomyces sp. ISL-10]|uniref:hypothetical protein n=1 Tax=Streptomyces sp. ISL-10 TaxID=2819172 RepID=UPI001BEAA408|nr:hypothetical protein [Streptomyces sp. ISL-10]MBT2369460.1 hypothetical protein [Streptomyces sp. ISL-10]